MENFNYTKKETYSQEDVDSLLEQNKGFIHKTELKPKLKEYEDKLNSYQEQQLFSTIKDPKKIELVKNLMSTEKYKDLSKEESFKKVTEDYKDFITEKQQEQKQEQQPNVNVGKVILDLHNGSIDPITLENSLKTKASTTGITDQKELGQLIEIVKQEALQSIKK